jgi:hypothetical protein
MGTCIIMQHIQGMHAKLWLLSSQLWTQMMSQDFVYYYALTLCSCGTSWQIMTSWRLYARIVITLMLLGSWWTSSDEHTLNGIIHLIAIAALARTTAPMFHRCLWLAPASAVTCCTICPPVHMQQRLVCDCRLSCSLHTLCSVPAHFLCSCPVWQNFHQQSFALYHCKTSLLFKEHCSNFINRMLEYPAVKT